MDERGSPEHFASRSMAVHSNQLSKRSRENHDRRAEISQDRDGEFPPPKMAAIIQFQNLLLTSLNSMC
jgi:hypothetical protein